MKNILAVLVIGIAMVSCKKYPDTTVANNLVESNLTTAYVARLNQVFDSTCGALQLKGASASIIIPNKGVWKRAYGVSHSGTPINTDMLFSIGSNTKTFTAAVILKLQEQGKLNINDTIGKWFNHPFINKRIRIKQLLNHTSGMAFYDSSAAFQTAIQNDFSKIWTDAEFYQFLRPAHFAPGTDWEYSNTNYVLLGFIVNKVTGRPVKDIMREYIFNPAGLSKTFYFPFESAQGTIPHFWSSSVSGNFEDLNVNYNYSPNAYHSLGGGADGCILSTAYDNSKFWFALFNNQLMSNNAMQVMQQFLPIAADPNSSYGLGLIEKRNVNGRTILSHGGGVIGGTNDNAFDITSKAQISVHTNQDIVSPEAVVYKLHLVTKQFENN